MVNTQVIFMLQLWIDDISLAIFIICDTIFYVAFLACACSSGDRAPASGAGCTGSIPVRRTKPKFYRVYTYSDKIPPKYPKKSVGDSQEIHKGFTDFHFKGICKSSVYLHSFVILSRNQFRLFSWKLSLQGGRQWHN